MDGIGISDANRVGRVGSHGVLRSNLGLRYRQVE